MTLDDLRRVWDEEGAGDEFSDVAAYCAACRAISRLAVLQHVGLVMSRRDIAAMKRKRNQ